MAKVQSLSPARASIQGLATVVSRPRTIERLVDPIATQEVVDVFVQKLPNTASVVREASSRFYPSYLDYAQAGAAVECLIASQAMRIGPR